MYKKFIDNNNGSTVEGNSDTRMNMSLSAHMYISNKTSSCYYFYQQTFINGCYKLYVPTFI